MNFSIVQRALREVSRLSAKLRRLGPRQYVISPLVNDVLLFLHQNRNRLNFEIPKRAKVRASQFTIPLVDRVAHKASEIYTGWKLPRSSDVSAKVINESDDLTLGKHSLVKIENVDHAILFEEADKVFEILGLTQYTKRVPLDRIASMLPATTSSCYPHYKKKGDPMCISSCIDDVTNWMRLDPSQCALSMLKLPCTTFHRFTSKLKSQGVDKGFKVDTKVRCIFGVPHSIIFAEIMCFGWVLKHLSKRVFTYGLTRPELSERIRQFDRYCNLNNFRILCGDITKMDASVPPIGLILLFSRLCELCRYDSVSFGLLVYHLFSPVISSSGRRFITFGGNNSGTRLTSVINTFWLLCALRYHYRVKLGRTLDNNTVVVHGDDFMLGLPREASVEDFENTLDAFCLKLKDNYRVSDPGGTLNYLGFDWIGYQPHQDVKWVIQKIVYPERGKVEADAKLTLVRLASICFQVVGGLKLFQKLSKLIDKDISQSVLSGHVDLWVNISSMADREVKIPFRMLVERGWRAF